MTKAAAEKLTATLNADQEDDWKYHVQGVKIGDDATPSYWVVSIRDEDNYLVGYL